MREEEESLNLIRIERGLWLCEWSKGDSFFFPFLSSFKNVIFLIHISRRGGTTRENKNLYGKKYIRKVPLRIPF